MDEINAKRILLAAPSSSSGKTTITCALLQALKERGPDPVAFKCGPDFIDPLFHKKVLGIDSRNLDTFFAGRDGIRSVMSECGGRYAVIEGVMGLYDGKSADTTEGSAYEAAAVLDTPIVLVVDAKGAGRTIISIIKGMLLDDTKGLIKGIILNRISESFYNSLKPILEKELLKMRSDLKLFGFLPKDPEIAVGSRHLGLMLPYEIKDMQNVICRAASSLEKNADVDGIISLMEKAQNAEPVASDCCMEPAAEDNGLDAATAFYDLESAADDIDMGVPSNYRSFLTGVCANDHTPLTLAVAWDEAFCFYYSENLDMFRKRGVEIKFFSPLHDERLPDECDGILLGGGYPENHLPELGRNKSMTRSIGAAIEKGIPSLAECGGFMYLHRMVTDPEGTGYELVGAVDGKCDYTGRLVRFGYMQIEAENPSPFRDELSSSLVGMKGHEFHYYDSTDCGDSYLAVKPGKETRWQCMVRRNNGFWGFPHFYYPSAPSFIDNFVLRMREVKDG